MQCQRHQQIRQLLEAALKVDPVNRAALTDDASLGDQSLSDSVTKLPEKSSTTEHDLQRSDHREDEQHIRAPRDLAHWGGPVAPGEFPGTTRFQVQSQLGSGSFGTVYECFDRDQRRVVALKVLNRTDPAFLYRFKREFRALVDIRHRNLVELYELFSEGQFWFFSMERVYGVDFLRYVDYHHRPGLTPGPLACDLERLYPASLQLAQGIAALHEAGIMHRDIKPGNVLVSGDGRVRLLDFGVVKESRTETLRTIVTGTPAYMSPEQAQGRSITGASDWYSFGKLLFQSLTGWPSDRLMLLGTGEVPMSPATYATDVPEDLNSLCCALLNRRPQSRPTGREVIQRLGGRGVDTTLTTQVGVVSEEEPIGRESQLDTLANLFHVTGQGRAAIVNLHGRSGIGKSTILRTFCRRLARDEPDVVVLSGRCHESETVPFKALDDLIDGLSRYLKRRPLSEAEALAPHDAQYLVRVFPVLAEVDAISRLRRPMANILDSQESRERAFAGLQDLLSRLTDRTAVVLTIDDLQWGDLDSAAFMVKLLTGPSPPSLLLIASYRSEDADTSPFLQSWRSRLAAAKSVVVHDMEVGELSASESMALADRLLSHHAKTNRQQAALIAQESGGSPFLIDQLAQYTAQDTSAPETAIGLQQVIERRMGNLPEEARVLFETIALAGRPISRGAAIAAAGLAGDGYSSMSRLVVEHLVRLRDMNGRKEVEVYHDRLRETIVRSMPEPRRRDGHLNLAHALEAEGGVDPAVLAMHFKEGGDLAAATRHAFAAAEQAANALAFDRAAQFYQLTLEGRGRGEELIGVQRKLATALVHAGRGVDAAHVYLTAAREAQPSVGVELKRLAAEQLLRSGHTEEGLTLLRGIARDLGIWLADRPWQATASIVWHGVGVAWHGLRFRKRATTESRTSDLMILDVYWSLGLGIGSVDLIRGWDFLMRHLLLALKVGDPQKAAMSMAANAAQITGARGHESRASRNLLQRARELSENTGNPQVLGFVTTMEVLCALARGDWNSAAQLSASADYILREKCTGVAWERATNTAFAVTAAIHLGQWGKVVDYAKRLPELIAEARARGDIHTIEFLYTGSCFGGLASDRPQPADALYREIFSYLPKSAFFAPHLNAMLEQIETALYEGNSALAWTVVNAGWSALSKSFLFRSKYYAILALAGRARAAVAVAMAAASPDKATYLRQAIRCARQIERKRVLWGRGLAQLIRACVSSVEGNRSATLDLLANAETQLHAAQMTHWLAVCRYRRGTLLGGSEGQSLISTAEAWARGEQVVNPHRIFDMLAPGRWER